MHFSIGRPLPSRLPSCTPDHLRNTRHQQLHAETAIVLTLARKKNVQASRGLGATCLFGNFTLCFETLVKNELWWMREDERGMMERRKGWPKLTSLDLPVRSPGVVLTAKKPTYELMSGCITAYRNSSTVLTCLQRRRKSIPAIDMLPSRTLAGRFVPPP